MVTTVQLSMVEQGPIVDHQPIANGQGELTPCLAYFLCITLLLKTNRYDYMRLCEEEHFLKL